ncbi:MAG: Rv1355c family protein [Bacteroidia bacterium]|nr:Rv1355c family protein [Bacteroidia bacterium]
MKNLSIKIKSLSKKNTANNLLYQPIILRLKNAGHLSTFNKLLKQPGLMLVDTITDQIKDLIKTKNPQKKFDDDELQQACFKHLGKTKAECYGVWVYYPWSNRMVHLLDEKEFVLVRTSRNHYKITPQEQKLLATKKIGVIGLSVGQSVSVTLAMERVCGELRLADFDSLELTNLNRIRTGVHNLSLLKVYSVAREISEIDPFIKIRCFEKGLHEKNLDSFFTKGGKLDLMVEESDGFDIKILSRYKARELKIPVIMEASDRCMVDVERFDLEPKRSILHGLVDHLDVKQLKTLKTNEEKIPYMLDVLGIETASLRLRASMLEIEHSVNTWPQLASAVTMGGGITADVSRRMLLNTFTESGRYYVDVEQIIGNKNETVKPVITKQNSQESGFDFKSAIKDIPLTSEKNQCLLSQKEIEAMVVSACKAPSGGNSQPWRWIYKDGSLLLFNPFEPGLSILDYNGLASLVAIGAAIENLEIHATALGLKTQINYFPLGEENKLMASFKFYKSTENKSDNDRWMRAIDLRMTNRNRAKREPIENEVLNKLVKVAKQTEGADLQFITDNRQLDMAGDLLGEIEKVRLMEPMGHHDFVNEMRWTDEENLLKRDGVDVKTVDLTNAELAGFNIARNENVMALIADWNGGGAFKKYNKKAIDSAGAVGVISLNGNSKMDYIMAGRVLERVWMEANLQGLSFQPVSACLFLYARLLKGKGAGLSAAGSHQLKKLRPEFERTFFIKKNRQEMFIFRLSKSVRPSVKSLRKPLEELFYYF